MVNVVLTNYDYEVRKFMRLTEEQLEFLQMLEKECFLSGTTEITVLTDD